MLENSLFKQARRSSNVCLRTPHLNKQEDLPMYAGELHIQTSEKTFQCMPENSTFKQARRPSNVCLRTPHLNKQEDLPMYASELPI